MKPHPRIRKTIKWGGVAATVLLVVVWVGSGWGWIDFRAANDFKLGVSQGRVELSTAQDKLHWEEPGLHGECLPWYLMRWSPEWYLGKPLWTLYIPVWMITAAVFLLTALAWRLDTLARRRARLNLCPTGGCGYDRTGLAAGAECPECGRLPT